MQKMKKLFTILIAVITLVSLLTACGTTPATTAGSTGATTAAGTTTAAATTANAMPYKGQSLNFVGFGAMWTNTMVAGLPEFEAKTGIKVNFQQLANDQISNKIAVSAAAGGKDLDLIAFRPLQETLLFSKNGWLEPLDAYAAKSADFDLKDFFAEGLKITSDKGKLLGIPIMTEREVVYYNKEMFQKAGIAIPKTLDELMAAAAKLTDKAAGIAGIAIRGKGSDAVTQFSGFLYSFGGDFITSGKASINTPEAIAAFEYYGKLLREYGPAGVTNMGWTETQSLFTQGRAAMRIDADSQYGFATDAKSSLVADKVGFFTFPAGPKGAVPFNIVAWSLGISSGSTKKDASWEYIKWMMGKEMDVKASLAGNPSTRTSTWTNPAATKNFPTDLVAVINQTNPIGRGYDRPVCINVGEARTVIGTVIIDAIEGKDVKASADKANAAFQAILDKEA